MIAFVRGTVAEVSPDQVVIDVGGVGFGIAVPGRTASALSRRKGDEARLFTHLHVREDALLLFGFDTVRARSFFLELLAVSGVGPKVALAILTAYPVEELEAAIVRGDDKKFESVPGIGKKLAQRLVIELKDKVAAGLGDAVLVSGAGDGGDAYVAARIALQGLGVTLREAEEALKGAPDDADVSGLVRYALRKKSDG
jgi:holliday junction DNA helicase RuvA